MKRKEKLLTILDYIRTNGACKDIDLVAELSPSVCKRTSEVLTLLEELSCEGEIIECRYVEDLENYVLRSIFFPITAQISLFNWKQGIYGEKNGPQKR